MMPEIDPTMLPGMPAPFWFIQFFKGVGFFLHLIPMNLWFAGLPFALLALLAGRGSYALRFAKRMFAQLPIFLALGVNFAIVPLLFLQTMYYKPFYTATILTAWYWIAVIPMFLVAYYAVYLCSFAAQKVGILSESSAGLSSVGSAGSSSTGSKVESGRMDNVKSGSGKPDQNRQETKKQEKGVGADSVLATKTGSKGKTFFFGLIAWLFLLGVGISITHGLYLMGRSDSWIEIWEKTSIGGAVDGLGQRFGDTVFWTRLICMFGLALLTTGFWVAFDSHCLIKRSSDPVQEEKNQGYRKWSLSFAARVSWIGLIWTICAFLYYYWRLEKSEDLRFLFQMPFVIGPILIGILPFINTLLLTNGSRVGKLGVFSLLALCLNQTLLLGVFVVTRQLIQNAEVGRFIRVDALPEAVQWDPLYAFLGVFVLGLLVIFWIIRQIVVLKD
ncbi:MAG: hypothetical protein ACRC10_11825 [Thermoguttaceae bacterium]